MNYLEKLTSDPYFRRETILMTIAGMIDAEYRRGKKRLAPCYFSGNLLLAPAGIFDFNYVHNEVGSKPGSICEYAEAFIQKVINTRDVDEQCLAELERISRLEADEPVRLDAEIAKRAEYVHGKKAAMELVACGLNGEDWVRYEGVKCRVISCGEEYNILTPRMLYPDEGIACLTLRECKNMAAKITAETASLPANPIMLAVLKEMQSMDEERQEAERRAEYLASQLYVFCQKGDNCGLCHNDECKMRDGYKPEGYEYWTHIAKERPGEEALDKEVIKIGGGPQKQWAGPCIDDEEEEEE